MKNLTIDSPVRDFLSCLSSQQEHLACQDSLTVRSDGSWTCYQHGKEQFSGPDTESLLEYAGGGYWTSMVTRPTNTGHTNE